MVGIPAEFEPVEAVYVWRFSKSIWVGVHPLRQDEYSKDFAQTVKTVGMSLVASFGEQKAITVRWPGGESICKVHRHAKGQKRWLLKWDRDDCPRPWAIGDLDADPVVGLPGDGANRSDTDQANSEFDAIEAAQHEPWFVLVKLVGEDHVLHARMYYREPPAQRAGRTVDLLPGVVQNLISTMTGDSEVRECESVPPPGPRSPGIQRLLERTYAALEREPNVLLVGPPGTGKSVALEHLRAQMYSSLYFNPQELADAWHELPDAEGKVESLVFHPSYTFEDFVAGLRPGVGADGGFSLEAVPGPLVSLAHWVRGSEDRRGLLVLDEFNRGNAAAIFGNTLALLDHDKRLDPAGQGVTIGRPYPDLAMKVGEEYAAEDGSREVDSRLGLPGGLWIAAAFNSSDRSVAPLDAALRRRFCILHVGPDYEALADQLGIGAVDRTKVLDATTASTWTVDQVKELAVRVLMALNDRIELVLGEDFLLGPSVFWGVEGDDPQAASASLAEAFDERVASTLRLTFVDQDEELAAVLKVGDKKTLAGKWLQPKKLEHVAVRRLRLSRLGGLDHDRRIQALVSLSRG